MKASWVVLVALVTPLLAPPSVADGPVEVTVRIEGPDATIWSGEVVLPDTYTITAFDSGRTYTLEGETPTGALWAAAQAGGLSLSISDAFMPDDLWVREVAGHWMGGILWWDYRVNLAATYYGNQVQWLAYGPGLADGDEVLWYLESSGTRPLRVAADIAASAAGSTAVSYSVEWPLVDEQHRPGQPWPPDQLWIPAHGARLHGDVETVAPAGTALAIMRPGVHTAWAEVEPLTFPVRTVRSAPITIEVSG